MKSEIFIIQSKGQITWIVIPNAVHRKPSFIQEVYVLDALQLLDDFCIFISFLCQVHSTNPFFCQTET